MLKTLHGKVTGTEKRKRRRSQARPALGEVEVLTLCDLRFTASSPCLDSLDLSVFVELLVRVERFWLVAKESHGKFLIVHSPDSAFAGASSSGHQAEADPSLQ